MALGLNTAVYWVLMGHVCPEGPERNYSVFLVQDRVTKQNEGEIVKLL